MKETLISNVISNLVDKIGVKNSNIVREVLVLEMKDIEIKERERQLVVYQDEITNNNIWYMKNGRTSFGKTKTELFYNLDKRKW